MKNLIGEEILRSAIGLPQDDSNDISLKNFPQHRQRFSAGFDKNNHDEDQHYDAEEGIEISLEGVLGQVIVEDILHAGGGGRDKHKDRRQKRDQRIAPFL